MNDILNRKRNVDVSKLSEDQIDQLSEQIGEKVRMMIDDTCNKINDMLKIYGVQAKMQIVIQALEDKD